ncbi:erythromycin esterase family protein [Paractinoplanes ferrugineus]|uniref:Erythromycin esterase n=1 Tax=Paractinoplanes ferrugineus TaxID=113564 RepID=A0A919J8K9_9ACTN|nr:erythromycin esterase family protein [Actinoplanes ferrugineus]GIE12546.1 erythromycin esterase [Actinoplanes ferrugineus]
MTAFDATTLLGLLAGKPRVLALGEPTHFEDALLDMRNDLFRELVEDHGYRTIAIESDCLLGLLVDDYVTTGAGDLDDVLARGISHEFGAGRGNRDLLRWMRAHNEGRPAADRVRFAGFDGPLEITGAAGPRQALTELHAYLAARVDVPVPAAALDELIGDDERWPDPAAMMDPSRSIGATPAAVRLRLIADDLAAVLEAQAPHLIATSTPDEWDRARLYGRTATGLMRYHRWMADDSPARIPALLGVRASMMAANLLALAERAPVLAFAHNSHLQRPQSSIRLGEHSSQWWSAGALTATRQSYAVVGTALGTIDRRGVGTPPPKTVEGLLYAMPGSRLLLDPHRLAADRSGPSPQRRVSPWFGYAPLDPAEVTGYDAIAFVKDC